MYLVFKLPFLNGSYRNGVCRALLALLALVQWVQLHLRILGEISRFMHQKEVCNQTQLSSHQTANWPIYEGKWVLFKVS